MAFEPRHSLDIVSYLARDFGKRWFVLTGTTPAIRGWTQATRQIAFVAATSGAFQFQQISPLVREACRLLPAALTVVRG